MPQDKTLIFIDTCSYLNSSWLSTECYVDDLPFNAKKDHQFWDIEVPKLINMGKLVLPFRETEELEKHSRNKEKGNLSDRANYVKKKVNHLLQTDKITIIGDRNDPFADATLLSAALRFRTQRNLVFITQDRRLAADLKAIGDFQSVEPRGGETLIVKRIDNTTGEVVDHYAQATTSNVAYGSSAPLAKERPTGNYVKSVRKDSSGGFFKSRKNQTSQTGFSSSSNPTPNKRKSWWES